ncbi:ribosome maturation factor RimP [Breznakia sp. PF5-3]|uniref:ribosome maturation factor RimP n=1 Tax=unclassified Breznakia TaxID=2623764 RepID=UPI00240586EF|nr:MULTISPECIES: ribosome maturation factor RimP [unclassified Breznakia]MDF9824067.1 ribosome maturation factor RimP [Breznakia sp. PM6-1]MDF9834867.1 ribosome maturation factor RimP [Breznakia sp. PF5-3]MDF9837111.1 ribosome maturation factor RimP [Breznakia sp. PFB2-8]MDF9859036.1 ribosome maturation factor RimP [Breznakia sp. PH5-24]
MTSLLKLKEIIKPIVDAENLNLYDIVWTQEGKMKILQVSIIDKSGKMDIDTCAKVSGYISDKLDELDIINYEYYLEVCSPGAERELRNDEELMSALGDYVYVKLKDPKAGLDEIKGYLKAVDEETIQVEYLLKTVKKQISIDKSNIRLIRLSVKI